MNRGAPCPAIKMGPLEDYIGFHLRIAQETAFRAFTSASSQPNFKPGRFATLTVIRLNPGLSQIDVCRAVGRDKSTISPLMRELEKEGLILRRNSAKDRRSVTLHLTPEGETALDALGVQIAAHDRRLDDIIGDAKPQLLDLLRKLAVEMS